MRNSRCNFQGPAAAFILTAALCCTTTIHAQINTPQIIDLATTPDQNRLLIQLNIGGATWNEPFLLDTGSSPLTTAHVDNAPWIGSQHTIDQLTTDHIVYGPGSGTERFGYHPGTAAVSVVGSSLSSPAASSIKFIYDRATNSDPYDSHPTWTPDPAFHDKIIDAKHTNSPPFEVPVFGTLGADLTNPSNGLMNIVSSQSYGTGLTKGFIINGSLDAPKLSIGPDAATVADFSVTYAMNTTSGSIDKALFSPNYEVISGNSTSSLGPLPTLLDTGTTPASRLFITQGSQVNVSSFTTNGVLNEGVSITMLLGGSPYTIVSTASDPIKVFGSPEDAKPGALTFGLNFFRSYEVLYNLDSNQVGIRSIPEPPPSLYNLLAAAFAGALYYRRKTQKPSPRSTRPGAP